MQVVEVDTPVEDDRSIEGKLAEAQKAVAGSVPLIPEPLDAVVHLPRGLFYSNKWENDVEVRELTGADEENLARFKELEDFFNGLIVYGVARIGSQDLESLSFADRSAILADLLLGEREQLFLHIARVTYGNEKTVTHTCPYCETQADTTLLLSEDIKAKEMEDPHTLTHSLTTKAGRVLTYRLATGADQMVVWARKGASQAEQNTLLISECVMQVDGSPILDPLGMARNLSMADRRKLLDTLIAAQPSPDMDLKLDCVSCGKEMTLSLSWQDIFRYE